MRSIIVILCLLTSAAYAENLVYTTVPKGYCDTYTIRLLTAIPGQKPYVATAAEPLGTVRITPTTLTLAFDIGDVDTMHFGVTSFTQRGEDNNYSLLVVKNAEGAEAWYRLRWFINEEGVAWLYIQHLGTDTLGNLVEKAILGLTPVTPPEDGSMPGVDHCDMRK